ncbi:MAG TPA: hypothetical protein VLO09_00380 [Ornithinimicrobium sp.]|nr:hypothetical protein [Ornithinimicrobium sp.]
MTWRYVVACVLVGVSVSATVGAVTGALAALVDGAGAGGGAATAVGAGLAGLIVGVALGAVLGAVSGLLTTVVARGHRDRAPVALRAGLSAGTVHAAVLAGLAALSWGQADGGSAVLRVAGVLVPSLLAGVLSAWACGEVAGMEPDASAAGRSS